MSDPLPTIAVIGGTGAEGSGLALRWALAGYPVIVGSRDADRAEQAAAAIEDRARAHAPRADEVLDAAEVARRMARPRTDETAICGMENAEAAHACHIAVLAVPYTAHAAILETIREGVQGKILVDVTVPLKPPRVGTVQLPPSGAAAVETQALLGDGVRVVSAFQNIAAAHLRDPDHEIECDVLVCGNDKAAREIVIGLVEAAGLRGWHAGPLANSAAADALTSVLISINRDYRISGAGIRITGAQLRDEDRDGA